MSFLLTALTSKPSTSGFITAIELGHQRKRIVKISTGSKQLDSILGGFVFYSSDGWTLDNNKALEDSKA